jgi:hypothetical protein
MFLVQQTKIVCISVGRIFEYIRIFEYLSQIIQYSNANIGNLTFEYICIHIPSKVVFCKGRIYKYI